MNQRRVVAAQRTCGVCLEQFTPRDPRQVLCSDECGHTKGFAKRNGDRYSELCCIEDGCTTQCAFPDLCVMHYALRWKQRRHAARLAKAKHGTRSGSPTINSGVKR